MHSKRSMLILSLSRQPYLWRPYGRVLPTWVEKLADAYEAGDVTEAIMLVPARPDTQWFRRVRKYPKCFVSGRLKFGKGMCSAPFPSMAVYFGKRKREFYLTFHELGDIYGLLFQ